MFLSLFYIIMNNILAKCMYMFAHNPFYGTVQTCANKLMNTEVNSSYKLQVT